MSAVDLELQVSSFDSVTADPVAKTIAWSNLAKTLGDPQKARPSKKALRLLALVAFGDRRTKKRGGKLGSLRNAANVESCSGVMVDYDDAKVDIDEAARLAQAAGVEALFYTSPNHNRPKDDAPAGPRWRGVFPLSKPITRREYPALVDRINGVLGGILAPESWEASRCYYVGKVAGVEFESRHVAGACINQVEGITPIGKPSGKKKENATPAADDIEALTEINDEQLADLRSALAHPKLLTDAGAYEVWNEVNLALLSLGERGVELIREYSAAADNYDPDGVEAWIERNRGTTPRSDFLHVFKLAAARGWENPATVGRAAGEDEFDVVPQVEGEAFEQAIKAAEAAASTEDDIKEALATPFVAPVWLIKGLLQRGSLAALFAPPNEGKSTVATDIGCRVSLGHAWQGRRVKQGAVIYVAAEDSGGIRARLEAFAQQNQIKEMPFYIVPIVNLMERRQVLAFGKRVARVAKKAGGVALIVFDTLSMSTPNANENTSEIAPAVVHMRAIATHFGCTVMYLHHTGKDTSKGQRGWSGLLGAIDTELEIAERSIEVTKQRNGQRGDRFGFKLVPVMVGLDEDGDPVTACIVEYTDAPAKSAKGKRAKLSELQLKVVDTACKLAEQGADDVGSLLDAVVAQRANDPKAKDTRRGNVKRALDRLDSRIEIFDDGKRFRLKDEDLSDKGTE